jgi:hypothetical protein
MPFLPVLTVPDPADARVLFDALNRYYSTTEARATMTDEYKQRLLTLMIAAHAEMNIDTGETSS